MAVSMTPEEAGKAMQVLIDRAFGRVRKSTCCGFYPAWTDEGTEVCSSCLLPVSEQPTDADVERERALDDDADGYAERCHD